MTPAELNRRQRAIAVARSRFETEPHSFTPPLTLSPAIHESWLRCARDVDALRSVAVGLEHEHQGTWTTSALGRVSGELFSHLEAMCLTEPVLAAVSDASGVVLWIRGERRIRELAERVGLQPGGRWDEPSAGTNALALALRAGEPTMVFADEHWLRCLRHLVCYAAPVRDPHGTIVGAIDLSMDWRQANRLGMLTVTTLARTVEHELARLTPPADEPKAHLRLKALGRPAVTHGQQAITLNLRQAEILAVLALTGEASLQELHAALYGDRPVKAVTLRSEICDLRRKLGGAIASRPYRVTIPFEADVVDLIRQLDTGHLTRATSLYSGQLLPASEAPLIIERRHWIDVALRSALLAKGTTAALLRYSDIHPHDLAVLELAVRRGHDSAHLRPAALARLAAAEQ